MCRALTLALTLTLHLNAKPTPTTQQAGHDKCPMCRAPRPRRSTLPVQVRGRGGVWVKVMVRHGCATLTPPLP